MNEQTINIITFVLWIAVLIITISNYLVTGTISVVIYVLTWIALVWDIFKKI